ncbi:hypothetical protein NQU49_25760, partial [Escherichia coli]|nr:hypothetical protein [Escherichia coli]
GAVMMPQFRFVYDGIATMLALLEMRAERGMTFSGMLALYPRYVMRKAEVPLSRQRIPEMFAALQDRYPDAAANTVDGLRLDWPDRWCHVRV